MLSYVAESQGPKHGVAKGMNGHIPVGMSNTAFRMRNPHSAQPQIQPLPEGMHVISMQI